MGRVLATTAGVLVLALMAAGLTEATLAVGSRGRTSDEGLLMIHPKPSASPTATAKPTPKPTVSSTPTPVATPTPTPAAPVATTNSFVHMRASNSTNSAILVDLNGGTVVNLLPYSDASWQQVQYNGQTGYVFKSYLNY